MFGGVNLRFSRPQHLLGSTPSTSLARTHRAGEWRAQASPTRPEEPSLWPRWGHSGIGRRCAAFGQRRVECGSAPSKLAKVQSCKEQSASAKYFGKDQTSFNQMVHMTQRDTPYPTTPQYMKRAVKRRGPRAPVPEHAPPSHLSKRGRNKPSAPSRWAETWLSIRIRLTLGLDARLACVTPRSFVSECRWVASTGERTLSALAFAEALLMVDGVVAEALVESFAGGVRDLTCKR